MHIFFQICSKQVRQNFNVGQLISNAHSETFCQQNIVAMRAQCVLVATTLLHSGAKFHSFLYTGSKTVRVNMESCYGGMSTRLKQREVTEFLSAENVTPAEIHHRLQAVYGANTVNRTTVNRWAIKFRECEPGHDSIVDQPRSGRPVSVTDDKHQKQVVTVDPGSNPDHDKLGGEIDRVKCLLGGGALAGLAKMALKPVISEPHAI